MKTTLAGILLIAGICLTGCAQYEEVCINGTELMEKHKISGAGGMPTKTFVF